MVEKKESKDDDMPLTFVGGKKEEAGPEVEEKQEQPEKSEESVSEDDDSSSAKFFFWTIVIVVIVIAGIWAVKFIYHPSSVIEPPKSLVKIFGNKPAPEIEEVYIYNDYEFTRVNDMWRTKIQKGNTLYEIEFYYSPKELEDVFASGFLGEAFTRNPLYVSFDPRAENFTFMALAIGQLDTSLVKSFRKQLIAACAENFTSACLSRPIINCQNTEDEPVIVVSESDRPSVNIKDNCVEIKGVGWDLVKAVERFLMKAYGIMS